MNPEKLWQVEIACARELKLQRRNEWIFCAVLYLMLTLKIVLIVCFPTIN